ncbi:MAG: amino acid adenylation domain-containing protein [Aquabacterium sp.]
MTPTASPILSHPDVLRGADRSDLLRFEVLADLFEDTARRLPDQTALEFGDRRVSYGELNQLADTAASHLIADGIRPGQMVGLWMPRGIELLVMQLAIAKSGAGWLPFDADTPVERIQICLADAQASGLVSSAAWLDCLADLGCRTWHAEHLLQPVEGEPRRREGLSHADPAYVIYTSGSTGKPKGIQISQGSICHFLRSENSVLGVRESDRVYQGFSVAFDMSFEEIWISYLVGATLWIAPKEVASNPEALPQALIDQRISVLHAVPTLLALFHQDVPGLRIINLGGEMCPETLVARWARPGRQLFNSYGPTEATVSASMIALQVGEPVTIGSPLPNYTLFVIDTDMSQGPRLLPRGQTGELCIAGPGVATGYLGRPELSAEKFLHNPWAQGAHDERLYRTGDLAQIGAEGLVQCLGRTDDQVKIRGFRVELGEIEAALSKLPGVGTVAVILRQDDGIDQLVAYLVPEQSAQLKPAAMRQALSEHLPGYMVPGRYELMERMPRLTSGKIDRKALKAAPLSSATLDTAGDVPDTDAEKALFDALTRLFPGHPIHRQDDFFSDLGGHSLLAARLASSLRADPRFAHITVASIYQNRSVGRIAAALEAQAHGSAAPTARVDWTPAPTWKRWACGVAQALSLPVLVAIKMAQWLAPFFAYHFYTGDPGDSIPQAMAIAVGVFVLATVLEFGIAWAGKWLVLGRLKPGRYPLWGLTYFRWWFTDRLVEAAPTYLLSGSSLYAWWLKALGARIGKEAHIGSMTLRAPDLLRIDDRVSIGNACNFENVRVERGEMIVGAIHVEADGYVGSYAVIEGDTRVGAWAHLGAQSALASGQRVPAGRVWSGSPAKDQGPFDATALRPRPAISRARRIAEGLYFAGGSLLIAALFFLPVFPTFMLIDRLDENPSLAWLPGANPLIQAGKYFLLALPASAVLIMCTALISAAIRWLALPRVKEGSWPVHSRRYLGRWLVNQIQESCLQVLHGVYATVYAPFWYRMLGAKVGRDAEVSTALGVVPEMLTLGDETFIADAVMLGDEEIDGGWMTTRPTVISKRSFVGNCAYIPDGTTLPENVLIGVMSQAPSNEAMRDGDTWLGSPPINLPAREVTVGYPESLTFRPSPARRLARGLVEAFRIVAPQALMIAAGYSIVLNVMPAAGAERWGEVLIQLTQAGMLFGPLTFAFVALLKWTLIGRYRKKAVPMWTPFVWLSEAITSLYEGIAIPNFMRYLRGTPWLPVALRLMGSHIGKGVYMDTTDITEFDCVRIGDHCELNALACPQTHLFEDRVMKIDEVAIGAKSYIGPRTIVLYSARVEGDAWLGPLTLVMKGEHIPEGSAWQGCPAAPQGA